MMRYGSAATVTTSETASSQKPGGVCRLRLTLPAEASLRPKQEEINRDTSVNADIRSTNERRKKRNGYVLSEKNTAEPPTLHLYTIPKNNTPSAVASSGVVYGVVQRAENNHQNEVVVYEWSTNQLKEEMNYIKDVRGTLEKIREKMFGEYDEMKQKVKQLTQEIKVSSVQKEFLESHSQAQSTALDTFGTINSSLNAASIEMQKTLVDMTLENTNIKDEMKNIKHSYEESLVRLKEKQQLLDSAQNENQLLKVKIESSQEANAEVMREMTRKLYSQYEEKLRQEELKYTAEKDMLVDQTRQYLKAIEDASEKVRLAENKIEERDAKIAELDKLVHRMEQEREHLQDQLIRHEERIQDLDNRMQMQSPDRNQRLEEVATSLRERIKHLDDMVHCQQKKVKHMIEEIELLKKKVHYKDLLIQQLLERIAFLEGENTELQDKVDYLMANKPKTDKETKDIGTSCNLSESASVDGSTQSTSVNNEDIPDGYSREKHSRMPAKRSYTPYMRVLQMSMSHKVS
ncbi:myocardial zonula adherens protein [Xenopus tropicalis]|uniref:Myocardial zonula adherens protein n=1 Tax=Xenopus tropicalis TaxID=8364 RepID=A0A8J0QA33_XENTR|nr:myocardial zonula adherens protein [Xenopus tropicalis]